MRAISFWVRTSGNEATFGVRTRSIHGSLRPSTRSKKNRPRSADAVAVDLHGAPGAGVDEVSEEGIELRPRDIVRAAIEEGGEV
jgi:hypothetical protein